MLFGTGILNKWDAATRCTGLMAIIGSAHVVAENIENINSTVKRNGGGNMEKDELEKSLGREVIELKLDLQGFSLEDLKRCLFFVKFNDNPAGKLAWHVWAKMTPEQKESTRLTSPVKTGATIFLMPGMSFAVLLPNGEVRDFGEPPAEITNYTCNIDALNTESFKEALLNNEAFRKLVKETI